MKEERYAVMIGLNDYPDNPLEYSVKDVHDFKNNLIKSCRFKESNIYTITDGKTSVIEQINSAFKKISKTFIANSDLILLYFSGHGEYDEDKGKSMLLFPNGTSEYLGDIVDKFTAPLSAKNEYIIIDACHAGKNIYTKSNVNKKKKESQLFHDSKEVYFLFAAEQNKKAYQINGLKNSIYTYYLNESIANTKIYTQNGFLSMSAIDDYVREKVATHSDIVQIPGSESRSTGYKPFAFLDDKKLPTIEKKTIKIQPMDNNTINSDFDLESSLNPDNRKSIKQKIDDLLKTPIEEFEIKSPEGYTLEKIGFNEDRLPSKVRDSLYETIIKTAKQNDLWAIGDIFHSETIKPNKRSTMQSLIYGDPEPTTTYHVYFNAGINDTFIKLKSSTLRKASIGALVMFYQTQYGFAMGKAYFKYKWNGSDEGISSLNNYVLTSYLLRDSSIELCKAQIINTINQLLQSVEKLNEQRNSEIDNFLSKAQ